MFMFGYYNISGTVRDICTRQKLIKMKFNSCDSFSDMRDRM